MTGGAGALCTGGGGLYVGLLDCAGKNSGINITANSTIGTLARWLETRMIFMVAPSLSRESLCARWRGNSIPALPTRKGNAVGVPLQAAKMESKAGKVKFHIR